MKSGWEILLIMVPGFFVGWLILDRMRRPFNDDPKLMRKLLAEHPATFIAACTALGSVLIWVVLRVLPIR